MTQSIGEQLTLHLSDEEAAIFWEEVKERGYTRDKEGAVDFIFDLIQGPKTEASFGLGGLLRKHIEENPDQVRMAMQVGGNIIGQLLKKARGL